MRVLLIGPFPDPVNGVSIANKNLRKYLADNSIIHRSINTNFRNVSSRQGEGLPFMQVFTFLRYYLQAFKVFGSDIIYITPGQTFFGVLKYAPFILLSLALKKPYVIHVHGNFLGKEYQFLNGIKKRIFYFLISRANLGIALSESLRSNFEGLLPQEKVRVAENFAEDNFFLQEGYMKDFSKLKIIYLSNLIKEKGILDVLDALLLLKNRQVPFSAIIAGNIENTIHLSVKKRLAELKENTIYYPELRGDSKTDAFFSSNIFILPTYYSMEGQPISIIEAMASGNAVMSTSLPGITDILDKRNAIFVDKESPAQIADTLKELSLNLQRLKEYSDYNISYTKRRFRLQMFGDRIYQILKEACRT
jgi:glycosyltransferase involved in cell wall biosynthesis